jgi:hypothetical protein
MPLLVYEAQFLKSLEAVHSKLGSLGEQCNGPPANGQGPCGCMAELLLSETVTALGQMGVPQHATNKCVTCVLAGMVLLASTIQAIRASATEVNVTFGAQ